jgi:hypothetical protein
VEPQGAQDLSQRLVRIRRRMAKRWEVCRCVSDPQLVGLSQELDEVLYRFMAEFAEARKADLPRG